MRCGYFLFKLFILKQEFNKIYHACFLEIFLHFNDKDVQTVINISVIRIIVALDLYATEDILEVAIIKVHVFNEICCLNYLNYQKNYFVFIQFTLLKKSEIHSTFFSKFPGKSPFSR